MAKGLYFYKLVSPYKEDITKNCKLTVNEVDSNLLNLKDEDIATGEFDKKSNTLKLVRNNGEIIGVDLSPLMNDGLKLENYHFAGTDSCSGDCTDKNVFDFKYTTKDKDANGDPIEKKFKIEFSDVDGKLWVTDSDNNKHLIGTFETEKTKKDNQYLKEVITDGSILGNGKNGDPVRLNPTEKSGYYSPAKTLIDTRNATGSGLPVNPCKGDRYVTLSCGTNAGRLYNMNGVKELEAKLKAGWRIPTKQDWDNMLNAIEPCQYQNHNDIHCHVQLGKLAGKQLKSTECWNKTAMSGTPSDDTYLYDDKVAEEKPISPEGTDKYGFNIFAGGYGVDKNEDIIKFNKEGKYWTSSQTIKGEGFDYYVKMFQYNKSGVIQITECPEHFLSLRLVKDFNGSNNYGAENIGGNTYKTVLLPSLNTEHGFTVWTATNINEDVTDDNELEYNEFYKDCAGCKPTYILHEWDGKMWTHKIMVEGDTIVIHDPVTKDDFIDSEYRIVDGKLVNTNQQAFNNILEKTTPLINLVKSALETETEERKNADEVLKAETDNLENKLTEEISTREKSISDVRKDVESISEYVINETDNLKDALANEVNKRTEGDKTLLDSINGEKERALQAEEELRTKLAEKWEDRDKIEGSIPQGGEYIVYSNGKTVIPSKDQTSEKKGSNNITLLFNANFGKF